MRLAKIPHLTKQLVAIKSLPTNAVEIDKGLNLLDQLLKSSQLPTRRFNHWETQILWATNRNFTHPDLLLLCHLDVVGAHPHQFIPKINRGQITGRGSFDMKGPLAAMAAVITSAHTSKNVQLLVTSDEEVGGNSGAAWFFHHTKLKPKIALVPDGLEENALILKQKGPTHLVIEALGQPTHGSRPWLGKNPINTLARIQNDIESLGKQAVHDHQWLPTFTPTQIKAETSINQLAASASMTLDIRTTNHEQISAIKKIVKEAGGKIIKQFGDGKIFVQEKTPIISLWQKIAREVTGKPTTTTFSASGSDARHLPSSTQTIITQVKGGNAHGDNEWVDINSLEQLFQATCTFIKHLV